MKSIDKIVTKIYSVTRRIRSLPPEELTPALPDQYSKSHTIFPRNHTHPAILIDETYPRGQPFCKKLQTTVSEYAEHAEYAEFFSKKSEVFKKISEVFLKKTQFLKAVFRPFRALYNMGTNSVSLFCPEKDTIFN